MASPDRLDLSTIMFDGTDESRAAIQQQLGGFWVFNMGTLEWSFEASPGKLVLITPGDRLARGARGELWICRAVSE